MHKSKLFMAMLMSLVLVFSFACSDPTSSEGPEGGNEAGESGKSWAITDTADETVNGMRLILNYNTQTQSFEGTLENLNTVIVAQTRVEVHVYDADENTKEYGPTPPQDMDPGEKRDVILPVPGAGNITTFKMHPEVGSGGEGSGG